MSMPVIPLRCEYVQSDGKGVGHFALDGKGSMPSSLVAVDDLLRGETAEVAIEHRSPHSNRAWGKLLKRTSPVSEYRQTPYCSRFGSCGGCSWQHMDYGEQLRQKAELCTRELGFPVPQPVPSPLTLGYRNKAKYVVGGTPGDLTLGSYAPGTQSLVNTVDCKVVEAPIQEIVSAILKVLNECLVRPYLQSGHAPGSPTSSQPSALLRYLVLRANADGNLLAVLVFNMQSENLGREIAGKLCALPPVQTVIESINDSTTGAIFTQPGEVIAGSQEFSDKVANISIPIGATEFLQVNRSIAEALYDEVAQWFAGSKYVVDLFCGVGGFAFALAQRQIRALGVEVNESAVLAANQAAEKADLATLLKFTHGRLGETSTEQLWKDADGIVVNPPRKGLGGTLAKKLAEGGPPLVAYISCSPQTLARDLAVLSNYYRRLKVKPYDMMPGTGSLEVAVLLQRI